MARRYLDRQNLTYHTNKDLLPLLLQIQYDEELTDHNVLRAGDTVITSPYAAVRKWSWLPRTIHLECVPEGSDPERVAALRFALKARGLSTSYINKPPTERSPKYKSYIEALDWVQSHTLTDIWVGEGFAPYALVDDYDYAVRVINSLRGKLYAIDYETCPEHGIVGVALADENMSWYIAGRGLAAMGVLRELLTHTAGIAHSAIYEYKQTAINSLYTLMPTDMKPLYDTRVLHWMLTAGLVKGGNRLKKIVKDELHRDVLTYEDVMPEKMHICEVPLDRVARYAAAGDARNTYDLFILLRDKAFAAGVWRCYNEIERPLTPILAEMELAGIPYDLNQVNALTGLYVHRRALLRNALTALGYKEEKLDPDRIANWFYKDLGFPVLAKTDSGERGKVDKPTLELLAEQVNHPALSTYLAHEEMDGMITKFMYPTLRRYAETGKTWLYPEIGQTSTATGRLAYKNPNLQQLPARKHPEVRKMICALPGEVVWSADYNAQEPRILSIAAKDLRLQEIFANGEDVYLGLGQDTGRSLEQARAIRPDLKIALLGWMYGDFTEYTQALDRAHPEVVAWRNGIIELAHRDVAAYSLNGRRRIIPQLTWRDPRVVAKAQREAINMPIQGTAADITKLAMIAIAKIFKSLNLPLRMIQVHDEIVGFMPLELYYEYKNVMTEAMATVFPVVPLRAEIKEGASWYEAKG